MRSLSLIGLLACTALPAAAQPWRYINKQGVATYTTNPYELPPAQRKKALAQLEAKRAEAEARRAAEAAAAAAAPPAEVLVAPPSIPVIDDPGAPPSAGAPASAAPASKAPTPRDIWQKKIGETQAGLTTLQGELAAAQAAAEQASRRALITPSGQNSAAHADAQQKLKALQQKLADTQAQLERLERARPR